MGDDFIPIEEAAQLSKLHIDTLKRLLRRGVLRGFKVTSEGRRRWFVSVFSLRQYADPMTGFLLTSPGPKLFLKRLDEDQSLNEGND